MFKILFIKEIQEILKSAKFSISFAVCSILILLTFYVGAKSYLVNQRQYESAVQENLRAMEGNTDWRMINHKIFLQPQPLAFLVSGISNDIGRNIEIRGRGELTPEDSKYNEDPIYAAFRFLDLNFLFQVILSLFAILLSYNSINGEKEQGTLRLIFSNSIPRDKYILAKIFGSFWGITIPLLIPFIIGFLLLILFGIPMDFDSWLKLVLIILTGLLFFSTFVTLSVFISTTTKHSSNSFLFLLVTWVIFVLVIPRASVLLVGSTIDVPSIDDINAKKSAYSNQLMDENISKMKSFQPTSLENAMSEFGEFMEKINSEKEEKENIFFGKLDEQRTNRQKVQSELSFLISRISPASTFSFAISTLAGTSLELIENYKDQAKSYQKVFASFQKEKTGGTTSSGMNMIINTEGENTKTIVPNELPKFRFNVSSIKNVFAKAIIDIGLLLLFNILFFAGAIVSFIKFDLR